LVEVVRLLSNPDHPASSMIDARPPRQAGLAAVTGGLPSQGVDGAMINAYAGMPHVGGSMPDGGD